MNEEIKEILDKCTPFLFGDEVDKLTNYITNLQEENEKVHKDFDELSERYFFTKLRNEKAIEYINNWLFEAGGNGACMDYEDIVEMKNILNNNK